MADDHRADPRTVPTLYIGAISVILLIVVGIWLDVFYKVTVDSENERKVVELVPRPLLKLRTEQRRLLDEYRWVDEDQGVVAIPIERAMELVLAEERGTGDGR
jgi:hypothetical protein